MVAPPPLDAFRGVAESVPIFVDWQRSRTFKASASQPQQHVNVQRICYHHRQFVRCHYFVDPPGASLVVFSNFKLLRGTIIIRTCDRQKKLYIPLFLLTIVGPDYYVPL